MEAMTWFGLVPYVFLQALLLFLPGAIVSILARMRWLVALACAPAISISIFVVTAIFAGGLGVNWNIGWVFGATVLVCAIVAFLRRKEPLLPADWRNQFSVIGQYLLGIVIAACFFLPRYIHACGAANNFAQAADNALHMAAINMVGNHGGGSPFHYEQIGIDMFYPSGFYDVVGLLVQVSKIGVPEAINATLVVAIFAIWPLGLALIVERVFTPVLFARLVVGPLSLAGVWMPFLLTYWGIVSPTLLALILAASLIGIGLLVLEPKSRNQDVLWALIIFLLMVPGIGLTQPVGVLAAGTALMPPAIYLVYRILRRNKDTKESISDVPKRADLASPHLMIAIGVIGILGFLSVWLKSLKMMGWTALWGAFQSLTASIGQVVTGFAAGTLNYEPLQVKFWIFVVALGLVSGLISLIRSNGLKLAMLFSYGLFGFIYAVGCSDFSNILRNVFTAPYYGDTPRLAASLALIGVPIAVYGSQVIYCLVFKLIKNRKLLNTVVALICSVLVAFVGAFAPIKSAEMERIFNMYNPKEAEGSFLTEDEEELIYRLPNHVGKDDVVAVNFWEGGGFIYALVDRKPTQVYSTNVSNPADKKRAEDVAIVHDKLSKVTSDPEVCPAVRDLNVKYALELEPGVYYPGTEDDIAGVNNLDSAPGFELVDSEGDAALYKITACG